MPIPSTSKRVTTASVDRNQIVAHSSFLVPSKEGLVSWCLPKKDFVSCGELRADILVLDWAPPPDTVGEARLESCWELMISGQIVLSRTLRVWLAHTCWCDSQLLHYCS
eukprot:GFUD01058444.1.p1 GENE.GFUD01058444.1~~GFUD01058444.1.p1  ORF type:complete len:109 (+),score=23.86 GFUD01058444.1:67-393(+)